MVAAPSSFGDADLVLSPLDDLFRHACRRAMTGVESVATRASCTLSKRAPKEATGGNQPAACAGRCGRRLTWARFLEGSEKNAGNAPTALPIDPILGVDYNSSMPIEVRQTTEFVRWFASFRDERATDRISIRVRRLAIGNPGVTRSDGGRVSEIKIDYGPGYRLYFTRRRTHLVILLCGGDKNSQKHDIEKAQAMAGEI